MNLTAEAPHFLGVILLLVGFVAGLGLSGFLRPWKKEKGSGEEGRDSAAYLKGINYILSNEPDKAIEAFSQAVQINSDTVETYMALGNLYRSKGEVSRAIRIHQSIIVRPNVDKKTKAEALFDLSLDFKKAGFVERAIDSFEETTNIDPKNIEAYIQLLGLYEDIKDWEKAYATQLKISKLRKSDDSHVAAHHQTELGKQLAEKSLNPEAKKAFKKAISLNRTCVDAYLHLGDILVAEGSCGKAVDIWKNMMEVAPAFTYLAYPRLEDAYFKLNKFGKIEEVLRENSKKNYNDIHTHLALAEYLYKKNMVDEAIAELKVVLELKPDHIRARHEMGKYLMEQGREGETVVLYQTIFDDFSFHEKNFQCNICGYESRGLLWRCPQCRTWDAIEEKPVSGERTKKSELKK